MSDIPERIFGGGNGCGGIATHDNHMLYITKTRFRSDDHEYVLKSSADKREQVLRDRIEELEEGIESMDKDIKHIF